MKSVALKAILACLLLAACSRIFGIVRLPKLPLPILKDADRRDTWHYGSQSGLKISYVE